MTEKELLERIKSSAEQTEVPESLFPESIKRKLDDAIKFGEITQIDYEKSDEFENKQEKITFFKKKSNSNRKIIVAASLLLVCGTGIWATIGMIDGASTSETATAESAVENTVMSDGATAGAVREVIPKKDAGDMYHVADNYGDIYELLKEQEKEKEKVTVQDFFDNITSGLGVEEAEMESAAMDEAYRGENYSKTNLQTEGVDESDIIKTDGEYVYVVGDDGVKIIDIRTDEMNVVGEIAIGINSAYDYVREMYVDDDTVNLIVERQQTQLEDETELLTYDISNRENPSLVGSVKQDGTYKTSRKVGDTVYLFTQNDIRLPDSSKEDALDEELTSWIPTVNDVAVAAECIYLPDEGEDGLLISSVDVEKPNRVVDNMLIINNSVEIYVGADSIYLYHSDYHQVTISTQIAKFGYEDGVINAVGATSVPGEIYDTFAINESHGKLRVLTTDRSREVENKLFLFDEKLQLTGRLTGIAEGEEIYAARYLGDMVYFVTYRNTDPLFAVDLSDEKKPKILSELKITGFSEYLHFWEEDKLVGIGYETDPNTGMREGIKLSMFDISDPTNLTTLSSTVLENLDYSPALYDYKSVLVDAEENLIGFTGNSYSRDIKENYFLFAWEEGEFESLLVTPLIDGGAQEDYRGIYVGERFYLVSKDGISSYNRTDSYQKIDRITWY